MRWFTTAVLIAVLAGFCPAQTVGQQKSKSAKPTVQVDPGQERPRQESFETYEAYAEALVNWAIDQRLGKLAGKTLTVESVAPAVGRFQVFASPAALRATFLVDTVTGASWALCTSAAGEDQWCLMAKSPWPAGRPEKKP